MTEVRSAALAEKTARPATFDIWSDPDGGIGPEQGVERRAGLRFDDLIRDYTRCNRPVLITDIATNWDAMKKWTPEYFRDRGTRLTPGEAGTLRIPDLDRRSSGSRGRHPATP